MIIRKFQLLLNVLSLLIFYPLSAAFYMEQPGWMLTSQPHYKHVSPPIFFSHRPDPVTVTVSSMPATRVMWDAPRMQQVSLAKSIKITPSYIQNEFQKHVTVMVNKSCTVIKASSDIISNNLHRAQRDLNIVLDQRADFLCGQGFYPAPLFLTKENEQSLSFESRHQYHTIEKNKCELERIIQMYAWCLDYNAGLMRSFDTQFKSAETAFQTKAAGIPSCELLEKEAKSLSELVYKEQCMLDYQEKAAVAKSEMEKFGWADKKRNSSKFDSLDYHAQEMTRRAELMGKELGFGVTKESIAKHREQLCHLQNVITYNQQCTQIQGLYKRLDAKGVLSADDKQMLESVGKAIESSFARSEISNEFTPAGEEVLKARASSAESFKVLVCDEFQKTLSVKVCNTINRVGKVYTENSDPCVRAYVIPTIDGCISALHMIHEGTPYEAIVWSRFIRSLEDLTNIAVKRAKDDPSLCSNINKDVVNFANDLEAVISLSDWCREKDPMNRLASIRNMCQEFARLPQNKQKEAISNIITAVLVPADARHVFPGVKSTFEGLQRVAKIEITISNNLKFNSPNTTIIKGVVVPNWMKATIEEHIKAGHIKTSKDITGWVERIETPLITAFTEAITSIAENSRHLPPSIKASQVVALQDRLAHAAALQTFAQSPQLVPATEIHKVPVLQAREHYRQARDKALNIARPSSTVTYQLSPVAERWAKEKGIEHVDTWKICEGSPFQQEIHGEIVSILDGTATLHYANPSERVHVVTDVIGNLVRIAHEANTRNAVPESYALTDACWSLLDYGCAIGQGVGDGVSRVGKAVAHPLNTLAAIGDAAYNVAYVLCEYEAIGDVTHPSGAQWAAKTLDDHGRKIDALQKALRENMGAMSGPDMTRAVVAMGTDIALTGRITAAVIPLLTVAKCRVVELVKDVIGVAPEAVLAGEAEINFASKVYDQIASMQADKAAKQAGAGVRAAAETAQVETKAAQAAVKEVERVAAAPAVSEVKPAARVAEIAVEAEKAALINKEPLAVLKNGYYEVNGFKFTEYYYNRLWSSGRKAPSLTAKAVLENAKSIIPDKEKLGFFKYLSDGWEMIYNPNTKEVWHLQPIKEVL